MIEQMIKFYMVLYDKHKEEIISKIQQLGVLHINELKSYDSLELKEYFDLQRRVYSVLSFISDKKLQQKNPAISLNELLNGFEIKKNEYDKLKEVLKDLEALNKKLLPWGDGFSANLKNLKKYSDIEIHFYALSKKKFKKLDQVNHHIEIINELDGVVYFVEIISGAKKKLDLEEITLPLESLSTIQNNIEVVTEKISVLVGELEGFEVYKKYFEDVLVDIHNNCFKKQVEISCKTHHETFSTIEGWIPASKANYLKEKLVNIDNIVFSFDWDLTKTNPSDVPVLLKNTKYVSLFEPITKLFALPKYAEIDLTPFFAPFFVLFFGICVGDFGYGLLVLLMLLYLGHKFVKHRLIFIFGGILSVSTIISGILMGTFFGIDLFKTTIPVLSDMAIFNSSQMFNVALILGLFQILFGMVVQFFNKWMQSSLLEALPRAGWFSLVLSISIWYISTLESAADFKLGVWLVSLSQMIDPYYYKLGISVGVLLILFFNDLKASIFVRLGKGLWELYNITGFFGDLLSYIRLFALGLSSGILGSVINYIAFKLLAIEIPVLSHLLFVSFLIVGHGVNLMLASLGSFVHPLRLTFVEFYKNAGFEGGGKEYKPFGVKKYS